MSDNYFKTLECDKNVKKILKMLKWDVSSVRIGDHRIGDHLFLSPKGEFKHMPKEQRKAAKKAKKLAKKGYKW